MANARRQPAAASDGRQRGKLLDAAEIAERCGVSLRTVRRWIAVGDLRGGWPNSDRAISGESA
jgi:transposase